MHHTLADHMKGYSPITNTEIGLACVSLKGAAYTKKKILVEKSD